MCLQVLLASRSHTETIRPRRPRQIPWRQTRRSTHTPVRRSHGDVDRVQRVRGGLLRRRDAGAPHGAHSKGENYPELQAGIEDIHMDYNVARRSSDREAWALRETGKGTLDGSWFKSCEKHQGLQDVCFDAVRPPVNSSCVRHAVSLQMSMAA
ncbi:hypothetical protein B0H15DRAFT_841477 [Mycena belliarum]|uniref:Uncharacterized protein n=1 Tax=Mycena belliarum TaxID=1033014 RepID=A0AAD6U2U7_9AGAR|nr:hypothetical protein B0H15DRAFT_841477 [Mycena belliae]